MPAMNTQVCVESYLTVFSGAYFFIGGPFLLISGLLEFFLGNTFTFVVFISYGKLESWRSFTIDLV